MYVYALGSSQHFSDPKKAFSYKDGKWISVKEGDAWMILPNTPHGFTVEQEGIFYFLSVQTPPIVHNESDDYHLVP